MAEEANDVLTWQGATKMIATLGTTAVIALWLVYNVTVSNREQTIETRSMRENFALHAEDQRTSNRRLEEIVAILRQMCVNEAKTAVDRSNCFRTP